MKKMEMIEQYTGRNDLTRKEVAMYSSILSQMGKGKDMKASEVAAIAKTRGTIDYVAIIGDAFRYGKAVATKECKHSMPSNKITKQVLEMVELLPKDKQEYICSFIFSLFYAE